MSFEFKFKNINSVNNKQPICRIELNGNNVFSGKVQEHITVDTNTQNNNVLRIFFENKQDKDTTMKGNQIVEDVFVVVKDLKCEITNDSLNDFDTIGTYITEKNENLKTFGYLSYNGTYKFVFDYPFFVFKKNKIFYQ